MLYIFNHPNLFVLRTLDPIPAGVESLIQELNPARRAQPDIILQILNPGDTILIVNPLPGGAPIPFATVPHSARDGFNLLYIGGENVHALHYFHEIQEFMNQELYRQRVGRRVTFHEDVCGTRKSNMRDY